MRFCMLQAADADGFERLSVIQKLSGIAWTADKSDEKITFKERGLIGADDGKTPGDFFHVRRVEGAVEAIGQKHAPFGGMIGEKHGEAEAGVRFFDLPDGPRRHMVERAVMTDEEFCYAVFDDMTRDCLKQGRIDEIGRVAVTDEEAGGHRINFTFCRRVEFR